MDEIVQSQKSLPPLLLGSLTPENRERVENFFFSVATIFEAWVGRRKSEHTRRAYRGDVIAFVQFMNWKWPEDSIQLLSSSILDVQGWKNEMVKHDAAPKTVNRRISSLSSFYKFLAGAAAEMRLPITVPNPAHAQFISREGSDPVEETRALSAARSRQLVGVLVQPELERGRSPLMSIPPCGRGFSRHEGLPIRCGLLEERGSEAAALRSSSR